MVQSYGQFTEGVDFAYWWSSIKEGLRLHPAQQACYKPKNYFFFWFLIVFFIFIWLVPNDKHVCLGNAAYCE